jgi:hypothetical protein
MKTDWAIGEAGAGRGRVIHRAAPRFTALWTSGDAGAAGTGGPSWSDAGSGDGVDSLHIFGFQWRDPAPDAAAFERLMREASAVIDAWIASRL